MTRLNQTKYLWGKDEKDDHFCRNRGGAGDVHCRLCPNDDLIADAVIAAAADTGALPGRDRYNIDAQCCFDTTRFASCRNNLELRSYLPG